MHYYYTEYYTVEKKPMALIIHSTMEIHYWQKFHHFIIMLFSKIFSPPFSQSQLRHCLTLVHFFLNIRLLKYTVIRSY